MVSSIYKPSWYVLHTRSRFENVVNDGLSKKSFEVFLPKVTVKSRRKDRKVMLSVPLFPGYIFVKSSLKPNEHIEIVKTVGAVKLIGNTEGPVPVSDYTIESLQIMVTSNEPINTGARLQNGDEVIVIYGPLAGVKGRFVKYRGNGRIIVNIDALGQHASVNIDEEDVERL
ncbi:MAG: UpxY family transcription antiterminator [Proteobacteria bacterium]|nr:UpxY family transcription antiterminator [Pseudomonadota bacterium]